MFCGESNILPLQGEEFATPQPCTYCHQNHRAFFDGQDRQQALRFLERQHIGNLTAFRAVADQSDRVSVEQIIPASMIKEHTQDVPNLCATRFVQRQTPKPSLNFHLFDLRTLLLSQLVTLKFSKYFPYP